MKLTSLQFIQAIHDGTTDFSGYDLSGENFDGFELDGFSLLLSGVNFQGSSFEGAKISRTNLIGSNFQQANLIDATFESCIMIGVDLYNANCEGTKFFGGTLEEACLVNTDLSNSILIGVDFNKALFFNTTFYGSGLGMLRNLDKVEFAEVPENAKSFFPSDFSPVKLDIRCIEITAEMQSKFGTNKELETTSTKDFIDFLKRNKIGTKFIKAYLSMTEPDEDDFQSVFISYSTSDQAFADTLYKELRKSGVQTWYAPKNMLGGKTIYEQVRTAIQSSDRVLLVLSENSIKSKWVSTEINHAYSLEQNGLKKVLFPVSIVKYDTIKEWFLFDSDEGIDLAKYIRSYFVPDFSNWQSRTSFKSSFIKLLQALRQDS